MRIELSASRSRVHVVQVPVATSIAIAPLDALIFVGYVVTAALLGIVIGRGQSDDSNFFLADHRLPTGTWDKITLAVANCGDARCENGV